MTALLAAAARAAHLIVDQAPSLFADTTAYTLLGEHAEVLVGHHQANSGDSLLAGGRVSVTTRNRYTEEHLAAAVRDGVGQYVILGAGLDSYAYRTDGSVKVFEVDHPATQQWKRDQVAGTGLTAPDVTYVPVDLETEPLAGALLDHGFDPACPALFSWLGVTMYLTREAIAQTLTTIAMFAPGTEIVFDTMLPAGQRDETGQFHIDRLTSSSAEQGEALLSFLSAGDVAGLLAERGYDTIEQVGQRESVDATLWDRSDALRPAVLFLLTHARVRR
ncbi:class I SAM-dependent methyltransferase [Actinoallomurus sp. CA-142502]|uniref:class I SAM-dependent methyltransferase n=1 Tax=Actinoallomurus sp. CA-142502 TaxID=3239885 RepID=UPI003D8D5707